MRCGWSAPTMPASPRRWWSSASSSERQQKRTDFSREEFVAKVWEWKAESGGAITAPAPPARLLDGLGERALHDGRGLLEGRPQGVRRALQPGPDLSRQAAGELGPGPRHRDLATSRSRRKEIKGKFWHLRYPLADGSGSIAVATTRPETMLADMAVAVHPEDERYTALIGKQVQPADHRPADPDHRRRACRSGAGLGRGEDHAGPRLQRFRGRQARRVQGAARCSTCSMPRRRSTQTARRADPRRAARPRPLRGAQAGGRAAEGRGLPGPARRQGRRRARRRAAHDPDAVWRPLGRGDRAVADRPMVCRRRDAGQAGDRGGARRARSRSCPKTWEKTFFNWMENIQPWCVSRQLWWGHRIPAWYRRGRQRLSSPRPRQRRRRRRARASTLTPRSRRARHLVLLRAVAVRDARLAGARPTTLQRPLSQRRADLRLRHPVLLGCADDDAGHALHGARCRSRRSTCTAWSAPPTGRRCPSRRAIRRSARADRQLRRRRAALLHGGDGKPGPRHQDG